MSQYIAKPADGVAWVTGASSGIGLAVAQELVRRKFKVVITGRRADVLEGIAAASNGKIIALAGDITNRDAMAALVAEIERNHGPIALAFLNAGVFTPDSGGSIGGDGFRDTFNVNVIGTINCLEPLVPLMRARGRGQIAVNASVAGYGGLPRAIAYGSTKAALINMCESMKFDLDRQGVSVQLVNPGFVKTPLTGKNDFPMPFLLEMDDAARRICDGFEKPAFEITFPKRLSWSLKFLNLLPYPLYFWLVKRGTGGA